MNDSITLKTCQKCGEAKPATTEFYAVRDSRGRDKFYPDCRECKSDVALKPRPGMKICRQCLVEQPRDTKHFRTNGGKGATWKPVCRKCLNKEREALPQGMRRCKKCKQVKPQTPDNFYKVGRKIRGLCNHCWREQTIEWQKNNPDKSQAIRLRAEEKRRTDPAIKAKRNTRVRQRYALNPYKVIAQQNARRLRVKESPTKFTDEDVQLKHVQQKGRCYWCGKKLDKFHVDHVIALSRGGTNGPENICCSCPTCNLRKNSKLPWEFNGRLF